MAAVQKSAKSLCRSLMDRHGAAAFRVARALAVLALIAAVLEATVLNMGFYLTAGLQPQDVSDRTGLERNDIGQLVLTEANHAITLSDLNENVENVRLGFDASQPAQLLTFQIRFTDEAHATFFGTTPYTQGIPEVDVSTAGAKSQYLTLHASGRIGTLQISLASDDASYPILLNSVTVNAHKPFEFNAGRFLVVFLILLAGWAFRPKSALYRLRLRTRPRLARALVGGVLALECWLFAFLLFFGSNLVGVATSSYNYGDWDGVSIVNTFEVGGENAQQYAELAKALAKGEVALEEEPPAWLSQLADPYDKGLRDEALKQGAEPYLFDVAYFEGKYYVYFGIVPALLFYLPFYLLTGQSFPTAIGVLLAAWAFAGGATALLYRFARRHFEHASVGLFLLLQIPLVACTGVPYLLKHPTFYSLPIALGLAFCVWGLYFWTVGRSRVKEGSAPVANPQTAPASLAQTRPAATHPGRWYAAGSLCMALVAGCRPQLLVLSCVAFPLFWRLYIKKRRGLTKAGVKELCCLLAPYILVAAGIMAYNAARFGSPFDFGANYNLTVNDMTRRGFDVGRMAPALFAYFLQPPCATGVFPFLQPEPFATTYLGQTVKEATFGGIFACLPILWVLLASRRLLALRVKARATHTVAGVVVVLLAGGLIVALADAQMAGILQRYYADFSLPFVASAVLLALIANDALARAGTSAHALLLSALSVAVAFSAAYAALLCFVPELGWYSDVYGWAYQDVLATARFWT